MANAGSGGVVATGSIIHLDGSKSTDVDGDPLTYSWTFNSLPNGSVAKLSDASAVNPTFTADAPGTYIVQLVVNDGLADSAAATATFSTSTARAPTANAGLNQTVKHGATVTLDGSGTDPQNLPLTFRWSFTTKPAGSAAVLSNAGAAKPTFVADVPGTYIVQLIVSNGSLSSAPATVTINTTNTPPVANAGTSQNVALNSVVPLDGGGSTDADGDALYIRGQCFRSRPAVPPRSPLLTANHPL